MFREKSIILFDLDGTITDSKEGILNSVLYALESMGIGGFEKSFLEGFIGPPLAESFIKITGLGERETEIAIKTYREYYTRRGIFENSLYPGIAPLIEKLYKDGRKIALATTKPEVYAIRVLEYFKLEGFFSFVAGSRLDGSMTDKHHLIDHVMGKIGIEDKKAYVMCGDRSHDIIGAKKSGIQSIGVLYGYSSPGELERAGADSLVESILQLEDILYG